MKLRKTLITAALMGAMALSGCGTQSVDTPDIPSASDAEPAAPVILTVSFGTSYNDSRDKTIGAVENAIAAAFPEYEQRQAFTSQIIIDKLKERDGLEIDNIEEALDRLVADNVKTLVVQPTHVMSGYEYNDVVAAVEEYRDKFDSVSIGTPLLTSDEDYAELAQTLVDITAEYNTEGTAIVFMGHGTEHDANAAYSKLQNAMPADNYFIGTVEAEPTLDDVLAAVKEGGYTRVVLEPLMVVAGDHANNDMAGDEEDSWKSVFEAEGFEVECVLRGLGEFPEVQQMYVRHAADAIGK